MKTHAKTLIAALATCTALAATSVDAALVTETETFTMTSVSGAPTSTTTVSNGTWSTDVTLTDTGATGWSTSGGLSGSIFRAGSGAGVNQNSFTIAATDPTGGALPAPSPGNLAFEGWELVRVSITFDSSSFRDGDTPYDLSLSDGTYTDSAAGYLESDPQSTLAITGTYANPIGPTTFNLQQLATTGGDSGERLSVFSIGLTFENQSPVPEPGSLALLGLGGLCMAKRRRRSASF